MILSVVSSRLIRLESQSVSVGSFGKERFSKMNALLFVVVGNVSSDVDSILDKYSSIHFYKKKKKRKI
jgi:uncharacterized metal-binding protein